MRPRTFIPVLVSALFALAACDAFEDKTPNQARVRVDGQAGQAASIILSSEFVFGVTEDGVTEVSVFAADTVVRTLPFDTVLNIEVSRRLFVELAPSGSDQATVRVRVDIDERSLLNEEGDIFASNPFRYLYAFNQPTTRVIEVI